MSNQGLNAAIISLMFIFAIVGVLVFIFKEHINLEKFYDTTGTYDLIDPKKLYIVQGLSGNYEIPNKPLEFENDPSKPSVDGTPNGPKSMFVFAFNKASADCCNTDYSAGYSTSKGCVCLSPQQRAYFIGKKDL